MAEITTRDFREEEINPEAQEVFAAYQTMRAEVDPGKQGELCAQFEEKLVRLVTPPSERHKYSSPTTWHESILQRLRDTLVDGVGEITVGSGTAGQRIYFKTKDSKGNKSADGKVRWMHYPEPSKSDLSYGAAKYRNRFLQVFGKDMVDLLEN